MTQLTRTQIYVSSIDNALAFYKAAFGFETRYVHDSGQYAELDAGGARLALASNGMAQMTFGDEGLQPNSPEGKPAAFILGISVDDVDTAYQKAVDAGAISVTEPFTQPWGQQLAYVRDTDGVLVEIEKFIG